MKRWCGGCCNGCCDVLGSLLQELFLQLLVDSPWFKVKYEIFSPIQMLLSDPEQCFKCQRITLPPTKCRTLSNSVKVPIAPHHHLENDV